MADLADENVAIPFDCDILKPGRKNELINRVNSCEDRGQWLLSTLDLDQLLDILKEKDDVQIFPAYSPIEQRGLPLFASYVKLEKVVIDSKILVIPLCDGSHFNGYVVNLKNNEVVKIDAMNPNPMETPVYKGLRDELFDSTDDVKFHSYFPTKMQFDSSSCS